MASSGFQFSWTLGGRPAGRLVFADAAPDSGSLAGECFPPHPLTADSNPRQNCEWVIIYLPRQVCLWTEDLKPANSMVVMARLAKGLLLGTLMVSIGFHWAFLQSVAWASMLIRYSRSSNSIGLAVSMTFDGRHPCRLCQMARSAQKSDTKETALPKVSKLDLFACTSSLEVNWSPTSSPGVIAVDVFRASRLLPPPTPPPRWCSMVLVGLGLNVS